MYNKFISIRKFRKERKINILNGLFSIYRYKNLYWDFKIFNHIIFFWAKLNYLGNQEVVLNLFPRKDYKAYVRNLIFDNLISNIDKDIKNIVFFRSAVGDVYNFGFILKKWMKYNNLNNNNTYFLGYRQMFGDVLFMFHPDIMYKNLVLPGDLFLFSTEEGNYKYKNKNFYFIFPKNFTYKMFEDMKNGIQRNHIYDEICDLYNISSHERPKDIAVTLPIDTDKKTLKKLSKYNLKLDNFVYIIPEAYSSVSMSKDFWKNLEIRLKQQGFDVFYNSKEFNIFESYYIASMCKGIIGITSGFLEIMLQAKVPVHCIYTNLLLHNVSAKENARVYSKKYFPNVNAEKIYEYIANEYSEEELINSIIINLTNKEGAVK